MHPRNVIPLVLSLFLAGCAHYTWIKPAGDPATFPSDSYACKQSALNAAPPVFQTYGHHPDYYAPPPVRTHCFDDGRRQVCKTIVEERDYVPPPRTVDLNSSTREDMYNACMNAQGWVLQRVEE